MPLKSETKDILGYYDDSRVQGETIHAMSLGEVLDRLDEPFTRWPVRNREPRTPISSYKRAIIHERDGGICRLCGTGGHVLTVDHIIPRSAFSAEDLHIADRSDNLISACWPCNEAKSNYERDQTKRLGVVAACWYCTNPGLDENEPLTQPVTRLGFLWALRHLPCPRDRRLGAVTRESDQERRTARRLADTTRRAQQRLDREQPRTDVTGGAGAPHGAHVAPVDADEKLGA